MIVRERPVCWQNRHRRASVLSSGQLTWHLQQMYAPKKPIDAANGNKMDGFSATILHTTAEHTRQQPRSKRTGQGLGCMEQPHKGNPSCHLYQNILVVVRVWCIHCLAPVATCVKEQGSNFLMVRISLQEVVYSSWMDWCHGSRSLSRGVELAAEAARMSNG